jgi:hypothetical protein
MMPLAFVTLTASTSSSVVVLPQKTVHHQSTNPLETASMQAFLASRVGNITIALYDVDDAQTYLYRPGVAEQMASIAKIDILATLLHELQGARALPDDEEQDEAADMIEDSDNDDAQALWDAEGGAAAVAAFDRLAGLTETVPNVPGYWGESTTTAFDQVELLKRLAIPNDILDSASREYELSLMRHVIADDRFGLSTGPGPDASVALKNGWVPIVAGDWQINSVAYVEGAGCRYLAAVLTNGNATEDEGITTIDGISARIWSALSPSPNT